MRFVGQRRSLSNERPYPQLDIADIQTFSITARPCNGVEIHGKKAEEVDLVWS